MFKKTCLILTMAIMLTASIVSPNASALEMSVGGTTWFNWWKFGDTGMKIDPGFLYGPALSVKLSDDFNMTFVYLYGAYDVYEEDMGTTSKSVIKRNDGDLAINYRLNNYFKIFVGAKYLNFWVGSGIVSFEDKDTHSSIGPSGGVSAVLPVANNFYLLGNISALYLWSEDIEDGETRKSNSYGMNSSVSLAYYIDSASTTISLGGRYQIIKFLDEGSSIHTWYGITLAANYSFNI